MFLNRARMDAGGGHPLPSGPAARPPASSWAQLTEGPSDVILIKALTSACEPPGPSDQGLSQAAFTQW